MIIKQGIIANGHGTIGNLIFYKVGNNTYIRTKPLKIKNPKTAKQQANRKAFCKAIKIHRSLCKVLRLSFFSFEKNKKPYNQFISTNLHKSIFANNIDFKRLKLSKNTKFRTPFKINITNINFPIINLTAKNCYNNKHSDEDLLYIILSNKDFTNYKIINAVCSRKQANNTFKLQLKPKDDYKHLYYFFLSKNLKYIEQTQYTQLNII